MDGGGSDTTKAVHTRVVRARPNWWVILAVSLALMALLVATTGNGHRAPRRGRTLGSTAPSTSRQRAVRPAGTQGAPHASRAQASPPTSAPTTSTTSAPGHTRASTPSTSSPAASPGGGASSPPDTTTTAPAVPPATTTTTAAATAAPAARTQTQGYLDPPLQTSTGYGFTGTGPMQISVLWSGSTYLTMTVNCPNGSQSVGGTAAMAATLPDASGSCLATVSEPAPEATALTFTMTIGPTGG